MAILDLIHSSDDIKRIKLSELAKLAAELSEKIIEVVSKNGGHLASSLGVVELTIALHCVYSPPKDKILWDVGHQTYAHKIITGRKNDFHTIRKQGGLSGFSNPLESPCDPFISGHASTSVSAALGFAAARKIKRERYSITSVLGDGALTGGMIFEALNNASAAVSDLTVILNDNKMSIGKNVGAFATYFSNIRMSPGYIKIRKDLRTLVKSIPAIGKGMLHAAEHLEDHLTYLLCPGVFFEAMGFSYLGPFDGHDIKGLISVLEKAKKIEG